MEQQYLIFLYCLPRSGSTLMQKILGSHEAIYTRSETWMMFPPAYMLKEDGLHAEYNEQLQYMASKDFIDNLPDGGHHQFVKALSKTYLDLYGSYVETFKKRYFLDKTPRYYLIFEQLNLFFPQAKNILLFRNPLAVLHSLIQKKRSLEHLKENTVDLTIGLDQMIKAKYSTNCLHVYYEDMVSGPTETIKKICVYIGIDYEDEMLHDYLNKTSRWKFGDQNVYEKSGINNDSADEWLNALNDPQHWRLLYDYLIYIGSERMHKLGYHYEDLHAQILHHRPIKSMDDLLKKTASLKDYMAL